MKNFYGLILAGGSGTRLWPISRNYYPKQFLKLLGNRTLIQNTFARLKKIIPAENIFVTTNRIFVNEIINQLKGLGFNEKNIIIQPADKNTGPAIAQAAKKILDTDSLSTIVTCPSDHLIQPEKTFISYLKSAYKLAQKDLLVTLGINPTEPISEYGYILPEGVPLFSDGQHKVFRVKKFIEKPDTHKAKKLIKLGSLWNSGIFIWKASLIIKEISKYRKDFAEAADSNSEYFSLNPASIDYAVLEKSDSVTVIPVDLDWKDIGSWKALYELLPKDLNRNVLNNRAVAYNCRNSLVYGTDNRLVAAMNLNDVIVVDTKDYVLIMPREAAGGIKNLFKQIKGISREVQRPLVSVITPFYYNNLFLEKSILSILNQSYKNIEIIVIAGEGDKKTEALLKKYSYKIEQAFTIPGTNLFEKINKGIVLANGEIISILKPGDAFMDDKVVEEVVEKMENEEADAVWGDLIYTGKNNPEGVSMYWKSSPYKKGALRRGWNPPFQTFFGRKKIYQKYGLFNTKFKVAGEYELMLRVLEKFRIKGIYIPRILIKMTGEGINLKSILDRFRGNIETYLSWKENGLRINPLMLFSKNLSKLSQLWQKADKDMI